MDLLSLSSGNCIYYCCRMCLQWKNGTAQHLNVDCSHESVFLEVDRVSVRILSHMRRDTPSLFRLSVSVTLVLFFWHPSKHCSKHLSINCYRLHIAHIIRMEKTSTPSMTSTYCVLHTESMGSLEQRDTTENLEASEEHPVGLLSKKNY